MIPFFGAAVALIGGSLLDVETAGRFRLVLLVLSIAVTSVSAFLTSAKFSAGDRQLLCWLVLGVGGLLGFVRYIVHILAFFDSSIAWPPMVEYAIAIGQNVAAAMALLLFVLVWRATGLTAGMSKTTQTLSILAGVAVAVVAGGYPLMKALATTRADTLLLISTIGDVVSLSLIVPLALPALAMRGGLLMHTWMYLAASEVVWLLTDIWWAVDPQNDTVLAALRVTAVLFFLLATVAQRRAMR